MRRSQFRGCDKRHCRFQRLNNFGAAVDVTDACRGRVLIAGRTTGLIHVMPQPFHEPHAVGVARPDELAAAPSAALLGDVVPGGRRNEICSTRTPEVDLHVRARSNEAGNANRDDPIAFIQQAIARPIYKNMDPFKSHKADEPQFADDPRKAPTLFDAPLMKPDL